MPIWAFSSAHPVTASTVAEYPTITNSSSHRGLKEKIFDCPDHEILAPHVWSQLYKEGVVGLQCINVSSEQQRH